MSEDREHGEAVDKEEDFHAGKIESSLSRLVEILQEANRRADNWKDVIDTIKRRYD